MTQRPRTQGLSSLLPWKACFLSVAAAYLQPASTRAEASALPVPANASARQKATLLEERIITATRTEENAARVSSAFATLDGPELLEAQIHSLKEAVNLSPGINSRVTGVDGSLTGISIRGARPMDTLLLVDGIKASSSLIAGGSPLLSDASTHNLGEVEMVRGAHSSLFGSEAIGGVLSLQTRRGSGTPRSALFFEAGSHRTFREGGTSAGSLGPLDYSLHYTREDTHNARPNNAHSLNSASLRLDWRVNADLTLGASVRTQNATYHEPGSVRLEDWGNNDPNTRSKTEATVVSLYGNWKATDDWTTKLTLGTYQERYRFENLFNPPGTSFSNIPFWDDGTASFVYPGRTPASPEASHYLAVSENWCADWQNTVQLAERNRFVLGASLLYETGRDASDYETAFFSSKTTSSQSALNAGVYAEDQWEVLDSLHVVGGLRYDHYQLSGDALTYRGGAAYLIKPTRTKVRVSYGTGFKEPTFYESHNTLLYTGKRLDPERSRSWDAGVEQYLLEDRFSLETTYFHNRTRDLIAYISADYNTPYYTNRDTMSAHGIETSLTGKLTPHWQGRIAYTWTESTQTVSYWTDPDVSTLSGMQQTPKIPRHTLCMDTHYTFDLPRGKLTVGGGVKYASGTMDVDYSLSRPVDLNGKSTWASKEVELPAHAEFRLYGRYAVNTRVSFSARVENLCNQHYESSLGYPALGRTVYGGVQITF